MDSVFERINGKKSGWDKSAVTIRTWTLFLLSRSRAKSSQSLSTSSYNDEI